MAIKFMRMTRKQYVDQGLESPGDRGGLGLVSLKASGGNQEQAGGGQLGASAQLVVEDAVQLALLSQDARVPQLDGTAPELTHAAGVGGGDLLPDQALELFRLLGRGEGGEGQENEGQRKEASQHDEEREGGEGTRSGRGREKVI